MMPRRRSYTAITPPSICRLISPCTCGRGHTTRGQHRGDPKSIEFCHKVKMNYAGCSPYRVPIARLAAAQAVVK